MDVDRRADRPLYLQLADVLRAQIHEGRFSPGERLPSESTLIADHDVSRGTVRDAIGVLRSEGLVVVEHGRGAYVRDDATVLYVRHLGSYRVMNLDAAFEADVRAQGRTPSIRAIEPGLLDGISSIDVATARGVLCFADGRPVQAAIAWTPHALTGQDGEQVRTRMPTRGERRLLQLDEGVPVMQVRRDTSTGDAVERSIALLPADRTRLAT